MRLIVYNKNLTLLVVAAICLLTGGCFTGVESTPKISASELKRENIVTTAEELYLSDIKPEPPSQWADGKAFHVTDSKIQLIFNENSTASKDSLAGRDIKFVSMYPVVTMTGDTVAEICFTIDNGRLVYRSDVPYRSISTAEELLVPFTVEQSMVESVRARMIGNKYYIVTPIWYDADGTATVAGLRHVPVTIVDVVAGNAYYPYRVVFRADDSETNHSVYMTGGNHRSATRNFNTLFAFDNPREKYPHISDDSWDLIIHSNIRIGMTRDECRLALGAPQSIGQRPTTAGMVELWQYTEGIYLVFEDGLLSQYRK